MKNTIATIGLYLCATTVLVAGCGDAIDGPGDVDSSAQPLVTSEVEVHSDDGDATSQLLPMEIELWLVPSEGVGQPHRIGFFVGEDGEIQMQPGDGLIVPAPGEYEMELMVEHCDSCYPPVPEGDDEYGSHLLYTSTQQDSGEEHDGSPLPLPGVPSADDSDEDSGDEDDGLMSFAHLMQSQRSVGLPPVELQGGDYVAKVELDAVLAAEYASAARASTEQTDGESEESDIELSAQDQLDDDESIPWYEVVTVELVEP